MADDNVYTIGRDEAAKRIGVSTRTLDRWIRSGKLRYKNSGRAVFVHAGDFDILLKAHGRAFGNGHTNHQSNSQPDTEAHETTHVTSSTNADSIYRKLYEDTAEELKAKQEKLEAAGFRVGQLEAQLKNSVPLIEYKQKEDELRQKEEAANKENLALKNKLAVERIKIWALVGVCTAIVITTIVLGVLVAR
jgi:excisionase family DNA binding protein